MSFHPEASFHGHFLRLSGMERKTSIPRISIRETARCYIVACHRTAMDVRAYVNDSVNLRISWTESVEEKEEKVELLKDAIHRIETRSLSFSQTIRLPENADVDAMTTTVENGMLIVTIPKRRVRAVVDRPPPQSSALVNQLLQHHAIEILG